MTNIVYQLPYPPSLNSYYRTFRGRVLISKKGREYRKSVLRIIGLSGTGLAERLSVIVYAYMPDNRRRDLDNTQKAILDSLTHAGVWLDDSQIDELHIIRKPVEKGGRVVVIISIIETNRAIL